MIEPMGGKLRRTLQQHHRRQRRHGESDPPSDPHGQAPFRCEKDVCVIGGAHVALASIANDNRPPSLRLTPTTSPLAMHSPLRDSATIGRSTAALNLLLDRATRRRLDRADPIGILCQRSVPPSTCSTCPVTKLARAEAR